MVKLKNLTTSANRLTEEILTEVLAGFVLYDEATRSILLTPTARRLNNGRKTLLFLLALRGWKFIISDKNRPLGRIKPKELAKQLRIPGNSLRPLLLRLYKQYGLINKDATGAYYIPGVFVDDVRKFLRKKGGEKNDRK